MALPSNPDIEHAYNVDDSIVNWDRMQEALLALKKHNDRKD